MRKMSKLDGNDKIRLANQTISTNYDCYKSIEDSYGPFAGENIRTGIILENSSILEIRIHKE